VIEKIVGAAAMVLVVAAIGTPAWSVEVGESFKDCAECPEMVVLPRGNFIMGSPEDEAGRAAHEGPTHRAYIRQHLAVGKFEVSFDQYDACVAADACAGPPPSDAGWGRGPRPAMNVTWYEAGDYVVWLSARTGASYRLLSETEWEYAARAGETGVGSAPDTQTMTAPVGSGSANAFGLHDTLGNVSEWVQDCWFDGYIGMPTDGSARTPSRGVNGMEPTVHLSKGDCTKRAHRGGGWNSGPEALRLAARAGAARDFRGTEIGFRVVRVGP
jgi:formylglycine-generating enzyme required for sulfatase activity